MTKSANDCFYENTGIGVTYSEPTMHGLLSVSTARLASGGAFRKEHRAHGRRMLVAVCPLATAGYSLDLQ